MRKTMKKIASIILFNLIFNINIYAHDASEKIPLYCLINEIIVLSNLKVSATLGFVGRQCYSDDHDPVIKGKKDVIKKCDAAIVLNYSKSPHDLSKLRELKHGFLFDMEVNLKFKDGTKQTQIIQAHSSTTAVQIMDVPDDITYKLYNREIPDVSCIVL